MGVQELSLWSMTKRGMWIKRPLGRPMYERADLQTVQENFASLGRQTKSSISRTCGRRKTSSTQSGGCFPDPDKRVSTRMSAKAVGDCGVQSN